MADIKICIVERALSDSSTVFDVHVGGLVLPAVTEADADDLARKLQRAILDHTNETVTIQYGEDNTP